MRLCHRRLRRAPGCVVRVRGRCDGGLECRLCGRRDRSPVGRGLDLVRGVRRRRDALPRRGGQRVSARTRARTRARGTLTVFSSVFRSSSRATALARPLANLQLAHRVVTGCLAEPLHAQPARRTVMDVARGRVGVPDAVYVSFVALALWRHWPEVSFDAALRLPQFAHVAARCESGLPETVLGKSALIYLAAAAGTAEEPGH